MNERHDTLDPAGDTLPPAPTGLRRLAAEDGSLMVEMTIALTFLVIAIGAMMTMYASNIISLRHVSIEGTALTLVDRQMEVYKTLPYASIALDSSTIPSATTDPYKTAHSSDATIPSATGQVTGGTVSSTICAAPTKAEPACAVQYWTGPDDRAYRVDSYITSITPSGGGRNVKTVTVIARRIVNGTVDGKVWGRAMTVVDQANPPTS